ncbi:hypothetical protein B0H10DRAFT_2196405 [Mycena sp. CBHHK59/15]|nr:hypothetical protein B0H10DRAFT_2196405 [Mycena sp. CBHHK59/15]
MAFTTKTDAIPDDLKQPAILGQKTPLKYTGDSKLATPTPSKIPAENSPTGWIIVQAKPSPVDLTCGSSRQQCGSGVMCGTTSGPIRPEAVKPGPIGPEAVKGTCRCQARPNWAWGCQRPKKVAQIAPGTTGNSIKIKECFALNLVRKGMGKINWASNESGSATGR